METIRDSWRFVEISRDTMEIHSKSKCQSPNEKERGGREAVIGD
jgi:hypothetical protein